MPTATLTFDLPEEEIEHRHCICGSQYRAILTAVAQRVRDEIKYNDCRSADDIRDKIWEVFSEFRFDPFDEEC